MAFPPCPESLKPIAHYLKIAEEHDSRDVVVSYWCRLHALEVGMTIVEEKTPEINRLLLALMEWLETTKSNNQSNEGITSKLCAQATIENYILKLFKYADEQDRNAVFNKNVVKAFYTCGILTDVLSSLGDLSEDIAEKRKYAKWKAAYIHNCLKTGVQPVPGPPGNTDDEFIKIEDEHKPVEPNIPNTINSGPYMPVFPEPPTADNRQQPLARVVPTIPTTPVFPPAAPHPSVSISDPVITTDTANLSPDEIHKAEKYCKFAISALNYDDIKSAIENLQKALHLLKTGTELQE